MYFQYLKEREGLDHIKTDYGFIVYSINVDSTSTNYIVIHDLFILPEKRRFKNALKLIKLAHKAAIKKDCKYALASVDIATNGATEALQLHFKVGMRLLRTDGNLIWTMKEL